MVKIKTVVVTLKILANYYLLLLHKTLVIKIDTLPYSILKIQNGKE